MAKRDPALIPLSHDHHHGLALALRLRQGDTALLNDGWTHDRREQAKQVKEFHEEELRAHFRAEEDALFPVLREHVPEAGRIINGLVDQHREIERMVEELEGADEQGLSGRLVDLGLLLDRHIRIEERDLFPLFEQSVPVETIRRVGEEIGRIHLQHRRTRT